MRKILCLLLYIALFWGNIHAVASISPQSVSDSIAASATIKEVIIEGKKVIQYPDKDVWIITKDMRKNAFDTKEMLGNIPGMYYNHFNRELSYNGQKNIKILMDGKEKPGGYVENLAHIRFKHVEITPNPQGLYRDYDVLINLITKDNYEGIEGLISTMGIYKPTQNSPISSIVPDVTFSYTRNKKINIAIHYDYLYHLQQQDSIHIDRWYPDYTLKTFKNTGPVESSKSENHNMWFDGDYDINHNHSISFRYTYTNRDSHVQNNFITQRTYSTPNIESTYRRELTTATNSENDHVISLYYRGRVKDWDLYGDFNYNYMKSGNDYQFNEEDGQQLYTDFYNKKHYARSALDVFRMIGDRTTINMGYINIYRLYKSNEGENYSSSNESRNQFYTSVNHTFNRKLTGGIGGNVELIRNEYSGNNMEQWLWSATANMRYRLKKPGTFISMSYNMRPTYPNQSQLNPIGFRSGYDVWFVGNPTLKTALTHSLRLNLSLGMFSVWGDLGYTKNRIMGLVTQDPIYGIVQSYYNVQQLTPSCGGFFFYNKRFQNYLQVSFNLGVNYNVLRYELKSKGVDTRSDKITGNADLGLTFIGLKGQPGIMIGYKDNGYGSHENPQGIYRDELKIFHFLVKSSFFNSKLQCTLNYQLPIKGKGYNICYTEQNTPYYKTSITQDLFELNHKFLLTIKWRFAYGHEVKKRNNIQVKESENNSLLR